MDNIVNYLTEGRGVWKHRLGTDVPALFNQAIMFSIVKMWMQSLFTQITPTLNVSSVNTFRAILLYGILQKKTDIHRVMVLSHHEEMHKQPEDRGLNVYTICRASKKANKGLEPIPKGKYGCPREIGLVGQEFALQNGMQIAELPPNKDDPMQFHNNPRSKEVRKKEWSDDNVEEEEDME
ncbi:hypothetical protein Goarm_022746 [Gossypium armourianum]|uniref:Uncharacterized protein n=1 Tax=Gossypium armourianum TaxID=34283 RepID=A0A7J9KF93_9ROSI|nr:hypothetical protein [Gossypium armourianum]